MDRARTTEGDRMSEIPAIPIAVVSEWFLRFILRFLRWTSLLQNATHYHEMILYLKKQKAQLDAVGSNTRSV
jgi:hypothetical protein